MKTFPEHVNDVAKQEGCDDAAHMFKVFSMATILRFGDMAAKRYAEQCIKVDRERIIEADCVKYSNTESFVLCQIDAEAIRNIEIILP